ncbi:AlbA family DNA-binding domain-containing protein [Microvirga rosea]|uniref:AlbA family DNA-binding domain-containing protein n=1 Tax=Microvirga rosea TaxID=2715425 RepID=UPI001D0B80D2|nr:ATP-binding protein [Microvirga rosea]MCB8822318.1 ATP-binding protein [Microvirga rosea]
MSDLLDQILSGGETALRELVLDQEESLHLEFKTLANMSGTHVTRDDRKLLAKALCGMANAEGGLVLVGIDTQKRDGLDFASDLRPFDDREAIRNRIVGLLPDLLSPQHVGIAVHSIPTDQGGSGGFVAINIPPSDMRPHMSIQEHRYYRRGSDGTRMMEHGEVRDAMMAPREASLGFFLDARRGVSSPLMYGATLVLGIRNVGRVPVRAPYMRFHGEAERLKPADDFQRRYRHDGAVGFYSPSSYVLHVEDEVIIAEFDTGLQLHAPNAANPASFLKHIVDTHNPGLFSIRHWEDMHHNRDTRVHRLFRADIRYGAENAAMRGEAVDLDLWTMFEMLAPFVETATA